MPNIVVPYAGNGLHEFILKHTRREILSGKSEDDVKERTWQLCCNKGRPHSVLEKEISDAVDGAVKWIADHPNAVAGKSNGEYIVRSWHDYIGNEGIRRPPPWSKWVLPIDTKLIEKILQRPKPKLKPRADFQLAELYANFDFPLCIAPEVNLPYCCPLSFWKKHSDVLEAAQWIVPNPCLACGMGGWVKTDRNADERIWLIIEFDRYSFEEQAKLLFWLERAHAEWDLSMIVYSGGKSLHGWFSCVGMAEHREIVRFFKIATSLGCDKMMRSSVQYTRFPWGTNTKTKRRQEIRHWNSEAIDLHNEKLTLKERSYNE